MTEYDERVEGFWKISNGDFIDKMTDDKGLEDQVKNLNKTPIHLGAFVLSNSKRVLKKFIHATSGFSRNVLNFTDTDSLYCENKHSDKIDTAVWVGKNLIQGRNVYKDGKRFYGMFLESKKNIVRV